MSVVADRFSELMMIGRYRPLSQKELQEVNESIQYLDNRMWKLARLYNFSLMAYMTNDHDWQHEICAEIERLERR